MNRYPRPRHEQFLSCVNKPTHWQNSLRANSQDDQDLEDNMSLIAKLVQQLQSADLPELLAMLKAMRNFVFHNAATAELYAIPIEALANSLLSAVKSAARNGREAPSISYATMLEFYANELVSPVEALHPLTALQMYLQGALVSSEVVQDAASTSRLLALAFELFDLHCGFQRDGVAGLQLIINALLHIYVLPIAEREALLQQVRRYASSLVTREAQVWHNQWGLLAEISLR